MANRNYARVVLFGAALLALVGACAKVGSPTGGPQDENPPRPVVTVPGDSAVGVDVRSEVYVEFSERMHKQSVENALFISPYPEPYPDLRWSRGDRRLALHFPAPLDSNRTYVVTVGTEARDAHSVRLEKAVTFAFATGSRIDSGRILGSVWDGALRPAVGITVGLYSLPDDGSDPDPSVVYPLYTTQVGEDGGFAFGYLAGGQYRVLAWRDRVADELIEADEPIAVSVRDVRLQEGATVSLPKMRLVASDAQAPQLSLVRAIDRTHVEMLFSEKVPADSVRFAIVAPQAVPAEVIVQPEPATTVRAHTGELAAGRSYGVSIRASDESGNRAEWSADTTLFDGTSLPDTTAPKSLRTDVPAPIIADTLAYLRLWFDDALGAVWFDSLTVLGDSLPVPGVWRQEGANRLSFRPSGKIAPGRTTWNVPLRWIPDAAGNVGRDTLVVRFDRVHPDSIGNLSGTVVDSVGDEGGPVSIEARALRGGLSFTTTLPEPGAWRLPEIPAGGYTLFSWRDRDEDGAWSSGRALPFVPAERWTTSDTVYVRARWTVPDAVIRYE